MDRNDLDRFYADNVGLIHAVARKGYGRLQAIGASIDYNDLVQELAEKFIRCYDLFDAEQGNFSTYFMRSAYNRVNRIAEDFEVERIKNQVRSMEEMSSWGCGDFSVEETVACDKATPEQIVEAENSIEALIGGLSPLAAMIARMAIDPPDFMENEFYATQAHAKHSRDLGMEIRARGSLNVSFICSVLKKTTDLPAPKIKAAMEELKSAADRSLK